MATTNTKKTLEEDFTNQPLATTAEDVNGQDSRTRLWQSLGYTYGRQKEQSDQSYQRAISQSDNAMLQRGMQRSSYGAQVRANLMDQQVKAQNDIDAAQIADYQNRISQLEQQEAEEAFQREQFEYQKMSDAQKLAYNFAMTMISNGKMPDDATLEKAGLSKADVQKMVGKSSKSSGSAGTVTWRQAADKAAKDLGLGFTGRNDPAYIAYLNKQNKNGNDNTGGNVFDVINNYKNVPQLPGGTLGVVAGYLATDTKKK